MTIDAPGIESVPDFDDGEIPRRPQGPGDRFAGPDGPHEPPEGPHEPPEGAPAPPGPGHKPARLMDVWVYKGKAYDLTEWINKHPGGAFFIGRTKNRDITAILNAYHPDPAKIEKMLQRYSLDRQANPFDIHPKNNAPPFLFKDDFNSWHDTPKFNFDRTDDLLHRVKARLREPEMAARVKRMDRWFNVVAALLLLAYFGVQALRLGVPAWMPLPLFVIAMVTLRSCIAGYGHYAVHRRQRGANRALVSSFDMNYVALSLVTQDGHTLLHHPHTQSDVDIKKNVFTAMMELPRLYRAPVHTLHKIGHLFTGMPARIVDVIRITRDVGVDEVYGTWRNAGVHFFGSITVRLLLIGEFVLFLAMGDVWAWVLQFLATMWVSTFLIVASHDFEEEDEEAPGDDWGVHQLQESYDLTVVGNRYVDCFLSAGLSPHRAHHVLPFQRSGFANIISEDVVREEAAAQGIGWDKPKSFVTDRLPKLLRNYLLTPSRDAQANGWGFVREHLSPKACKASFVYARAGFGGISSV